MSEGFQALAQDESRVHHTGTIVYTNIGAHARRPDGPTQNVQGLLRHAALAHFEQIATIRQAQGRRVCLYITVAVFLVHGAIRHQRVALVEIRVMHEGLIVRPQRDRVIVWWGLETTVRAWRREAIIVGTEAA